MTDDNPFGDRISVVQDPPGTCALCGRTAVDHRRFTHAVPFTDEERAVSAEMDRDHRADDDITPAGIKAFLQDRERRRDQRAVQRFLDDPAVRKRLASRLFGTYGDEVRGPLAHPWNEDADRILRALRGSDEEGAG